MIMPRCNGPYFRQHQLFRFIALIPDNLAKLALVLSKQGQSEFNSVNRRRDGATALWQSLPPVYRQCAICYSDFWEAYQTVLPRQRCQR